MTNDERADLAMYALFAFAQVTNTVGEDRETIIVDLLADLRHLCTREKWDYDRLELAASNHYADELREEPAPEPDAASYEAAMTRETAETPSTKWYIVVGRAHGDDECSSAVYEAIDALDAEQQFDAAMRESHEWPTERADDDEAEGRIVYLDQTFECDTAPRLQ